MNNCYFPHDSNARNSKKILRLRRSLGAEGYGTYFMLLERLREEKDFTCDADFDMLSFDLRVSPDIIRSVVEDFGLFEYNTDKTKFYSAGFNERMDIKDKRIEAGRKGAEARWGQKAENPSEMAQNGKNMANAIAKDICHDFANSSSSDKEKKSKEKESKENYCSSSQTLPPAVAAAREEEGFEEQEEEIILSFFLKNWRCPVEEYHKMVNYNSVGGRDWTKMTYNQRRATAQLWKQKPDAPPRFERRILELWSDLYHKAKELGANIFVRRSLLSDKLDIRVRGDDLVIIAPEIVYDFIEHDHLDEYKCIFKPFMANNDLKQLYYE